MKQLTYEFVCHEASASDTGQKAYLSVTLPPPQPAADGYGNPVAHPPPPSGTMRVFVTSDERRAALRLANDTARDAKKIRPELIKDADERKAAEKEKAKLTKMLETHLATANASKEFRFKHGAKYRITVEEV